MGMSTTQTARQHGGDMGKSMKGEKTMSRWCVVGFGHTDPERKPESIEVNELDKLQDAATELFRRGYTQIRNVRRNFVVWP